MLAVNVASTVETSADSGEEDDAAIWIHPTDPAMSRVIGTVKTSGSSLRVYNLAGQQVQSVSASQVNNVDLRYNFELSGEPVAIVAGSNRSNNSIVLYTMSAGGLQNVAARTISTGMDIYGCAMYVSPVTGKYYVFVSSESGQVQQWELFDNGAGKVDATRVRTITVGSQAEGIVADDVLGHLYIGEESSGIWKYSAEPGDSTSRTRVDTTGSGGHLDADVEGLAIYYASDGTGYLIASSQGNNEFAVYRREGNNEYINSFRLVSGNGIDAVSDTDGIDVTNFALGPQFPNGMFIAQDNNDNFKFVKWEAIDAAFGGILTSDTSWDPRKVGQVAEPPDPNVSQGDYNRDGTANAADYVVWRKVRGATGIPAYSPGDGTGDSQINNNDYQVWFENYGAQIPAGDALLKESVRAVSNRDYGSAINGLLMSQHEVDVENAASLVPLLNIKPAANTATRNDLAWAALWDAGDDSKTDEMDERSSKIDEPISVRGMDENIDDGLSVMSQSLKVDITPE